MRTPKGAPPNALKCPALNLIRRGRRTIAYWKEGGQKYQVSLGSGLSALEEKRRQAELSIVLADHTAGKSIAIPDWAESSKPLERWLGSSGNGNGNSAPTVATLRLLYVAAKEASGLRPASVRRIADALANWVTWQGDSGPPSPLTELDQEDVDAFVAWRRHEGMSDRTVNLDVATLKGALAWAVETGLLSCNPIPKLKAPIPKGRVEESFERRVLSSDEQASLIAASPAPYDLVWDTFLKTGLRRGELSRAVWLDVDLEEETWMIPAKGSKNRRGAQLPLPSSLAGRLRKHRNRERKAGAGSEGDSVFRNALGNPLGAALLRTFYACLRRAGIPRRDVRGRQVDIHALRHTYGTMMASRVDPRTLQSLMRHANVETTLSYYVHADGGRARDAVNDL